MKLRLFLAWVLLGFAPAAHAQESVSVEMESPSLMRVAADFDEGRNLMYCLFGRITSASRVRVHVDSIALVESPNACNGMGFAFASRIPDRAFLAQILRGLIDSSPRFAVVSAFYATEEIELHGDRFRAARAFSVVRGVTTTVRGLTGD
jgi:hypothetical protein